MIINVCWSSCIVPDIFVSELEFLRHILEKYTNIKCHENRSRGSRIVLCGQTDRHTNMTKLIVAFRNFAKAPTMCTYTLHVLGMYVIRKIEQEYDYWHTGREINWCNRQVG
jgi:hypothetical protein